ncbi:polysaccharide deacetylase family protein [Arthrobacter mobilis]|uniref:Polysaccharide deacetylase family protein n=1 Tax=Arthrobacter mobilis TaxID=2724944 RepID=A0A7X6HFS1_9MICC|nr:polysaccharide deacetylase family protein [Arthrobacter mobilis]NKX55394.1 polysaccharide deacetylase family protein [Arthrobacter mobilis]
MRIHRILIVLATAVCLTATGIAPDAQAAVPWTKSEARGPNHTSRVVLTYDDCPRTLVSYVKVLDYAKKKNIGLVLAPSGRCLEKYRKNYGTDLAVLARAYGQYVINHSINHRPDMKELSCDEVARELGAPGVVTNFGRPPYGRINDTVRCGYAKAGMTPWLWTRGTYDTRGKTKAQVVATAAKIATRGGTVLMHMQWNGFAPDAISKIKAKLARRGLKLCRAWRGNDNEGSVVTSPVMLPQRLPC